MSEIAPPHRVWSLDHWPSTPFICTAITQEIYRTSYYRHDDEQTLLAHLSGKFSHQPELVATEALGHILSSSEPSREALRGILQANGLDIGTISSIQTEVIGDEGERPDLVCSDRAGEERLLIEAKFWAGLPSTNP